ncbi:hypothetical protein QHI69_38250 (plasmid) [Burkholderia gladioli pv. gladioli]|uniref:Uncharacterized protein n=1 Tax=Burkholderia gladioli TaxID=28095 RepID=A0AAW3F8K3_BURGA|nr:hypothetical protein [Burkholderia gladioli]AJW93776.1 hypothetical protein BM43_7488 [Burkholderia gladioli]KGC16852.1 hypothetical protein DM48_3372 [Burkholderia gladioli]MDJ1167760.1 hypothetical protein [Burkholderia gladioli pv. gladioli]QPQ88938.1 hypothetical protein I6H08_36680 [Burkholderia gladioli]SPU96194.1 Uncharacterised protein [Burkholderia gladioli]
MSHVTKPLKKTAPTTAAVKVVVRVSERKKKPAPLTTADKVGMRAAARRPSTRVTPELPEWRKAI